MQYEELVGGREGPGSEGLQYEELVGGGRGLGARVCSMKDWWAEGGAWESSVFVSPRQISRQLWDDAIEGSSSYGGEGPGGEGL